jgi:frataxin-like iron-binding protein CyaY
MEYYKIDEATARTAHSMVHMSDYAPDSCTNGYKAEVDRAAALVEAQKAKVSPYYHDKLDALLDRYARRLAQWHNDYNRNQAAYPSQFISGAGGYNMKKHNKQMAREGKLWQEYDQINDILAQIRSTGTGPVDPADPHAREILEERLQKLQITLERGKAMNAHYRKHKTLKGFDGLTDEKAAEMDAALEAAPPFARTPYPDFELSSLRGKIKRTQENLQKLESMEQHKTDPANNLEFDGGKLYLNMEENRLQILFDDKPDEDTRAALKTNGFHWSPKNKVWQRQLTNNAISAAKRLLNISSSQSPLVSASACGESSALSLAPPLPTEPAPLGFGGDPQNEPDEDEYDTYATPDGQIPLF